MNAEERRGSVAFHKQSVFVESTLPEPDFAGVSAQVSGMGVIQPRVSRNACVGITNGQPWHGNTGVKDFSLTTVRRRLADCAAACSMLQSVRTNSERHEL